MTSRSVSLRSFLAGLAMVATASALPSLPARAAGPHPPEQPGQPAQPAEPTQWKTCHFEGSGGVGRPLAFIVLEPFEFQPGTPGALEPIGQFERDPGVDSVVPGYARFSSATYGCDVYDTRAAADARAARVARWRGYNIVRSVQWTPPASVTGLAGARKAAVGVRAVAGRPAEGTGGATVVAADTGARDAARAWDAQAKQALAAEAQQRVAAAVRAARAEATRKAEIERFLAERRRQGRAQ